MLGHVPCHLGKYKVEPLLHFFTPKLVLEGATNVKKINVLEKNATFCKI